VQLTAECLEAADRYGRATSAYHDWQAAPSPATAAACQQAVDRALAYLQEVADEEVVSEVALAAQLKYYREQIEQGGANPDSARAQPGWNDEATFSDLRAEYEEVGPLPRLWKFHPNPQDEGQQAGWFADDYLRKNWVLSPGESRVRESRTHGLERGCWKRGGPSVRDRYTRALT
jgi:hypothetical protein